MIEHPIHPVVVHFPIALLSTAVLFEILGFLLRREQYRQFGFWLLSLGMTAGLVAAGFGLWGEEAAEKMGVPEKAIERHESFAVTTLITFGILLIYRRWARDRWSVRHKTVYAFIAVLGLALLGTTGYFGGDLVYRYGAGVTKQTVGTPESPAIRPSSDEPEGGYSGP